MRGVRHAALGLFFAAACGSNAAVRGGDAGPFPADASDAGPPARPVGMLAAAAGTRHVLLRAGAPAQEEPSLAISSGTLGVGMRASNRPGADDWHLRLGVAPIAPDRTAGPFAFADV